MRELAEGVSAPLITECDVRSDEDLERVFGEVGEAFGGKLDLLVHSVAFADARDLEGRFTDTPRDRFWLALDVSAYSLVACSRLAEPLMEAAGGGSIMTMTYLGGERAVPHYNVMGVAKATLDSSMRYLAWDLGQKNIRVNAVSAGPVRTLAARSIAGFPTMEAIVEERAPLHRPIDADDVGEAAAFLLSDEAKNITGHDAVRRRRLPRDGYVATAGRRRLTACTGSLGRRARRAARKAHEHRICRDCEWKRRWSATFSSAAGRHTRSGAWLDAYESLSLADEVDSLDAEDLELLARSAYMLGRDDDYVRGLERAHHAHLDAGDVPGAARCTWWIGHNLLFRGETARANGWFGRGDRLLDREGRDCVERGYLLIPVLLRAGASDDAGAEYATATKAAAIGERYDDLDLVTIARMGQGHALLRKGRTEEGFRLVDETMVAVTTGELSPIVAGIVYCNTIAICQEATRYAALASGPMP